MGGKRRRNKKPRQIAPPSSVWRNFALDAAEGCYIAHGDANWVIESSPFDPDEWDDPSSVPELSVDPETLLLSAINTSTRYKTFFISFPYTAVGKRDQPLRKGQYVSENGDTRQITTLVLILEPHQVMDLCMIDYDGTGELELSSDIKELPEGWNFSCLENKSDEEPIGPYLFPIGGNKKVYCSQGVNGAFTHFYPQTRYAVDLACSIGTEILAVADGIVLEVNQSNVVSGIHVDNLFKWNSIMLQLDDGNFVEYVHIQTNSALVKKGDHVKEGQVICKAGNIGFCPSPHLHIQFHKSQELNAPTVPFTFKTPNSSGKPFCPLAGKLYDCN